MRTAIFVSSPARFGGFHGGRADAPKPDRSDGLRHRGQAPVPDGGVRRRRRDPGQVRQAGAIVAHCKEMTGIYASYKKAWADQAKKFIADLRPADLPKTVVYPFGGGDLRVGARRVSRRDRDHDDLARGRRRRAHDRHDHEGASSPATLDEIGNDIRRLYRSAHSTTKSLQQASHSTVPGTIMFALAGARRARHGAGVAPLLRPRARRQAHVPDERGARSARRRVRGAAKRGKTPPKNYTHYWYEQDSAFANVEIDVSPARRRDRARCAPIATSSRTSTIRTWRRTTACSSTSR